MLEYTLKTQVKRNDKKSNKSKTTMIPVCPGRHLDNKACPIQRVIWIRGRQYSAYEDLDASERFKDVFANSFANRGLRRSGCLANERLAKNLDHYLRNPTVYSFNSFQDLFYRCLPQVYGYLQYTPNVVFQNMNPVWITMTGSRSMDFQAANQKAGLSGTPKGYTWHHIEGINTTQGRIECRMILLESDYHRVWHVGSVNQYEIATGTDYH